MIETLQASRADHNLAVSPKYKANINFEQVFELGSLGTLVPWVNVHWEDDAYLTVWNVDKHTDDMNFAIRDEDIRYTDDRRKAFTTVNATHVWPAFPHGFRNVGFALG